MVEVRWAHRGDAPKVYPLFRALVEAEKVEPPSPAEFSRTWGKVFHPDSRSRFVVAEVEDKGVVGCMSLHEHFSTWKGRSVLSLEDFFVLEAERGKGIGKAMLAFAEAHATTRGAARIELDVRADNERAQKLYQGAGFEEQPYRWYHKRIVAPEPPRRRPEADAPEGSKRRRRRGRRA